VRFGQWKAVRNGPGADLELFDLAKDSAETTDLAASQPALVAKATALMKQARVDDPNWAWVDKAKAKGKKANKKS
jgi:arylsulfatase A-like enzyme